MSDLNDLLINFKLIAFFHYFRIMLRMLMPKNLIQVCIFLEYQVKYTLFCNDIFEFFY